MKDSIQTKLLNEKIIVLQTKVDSLINTDKLHKLQFDINQRQNIISQVNDFYDSAWLKLLFVITILGILVPLIAQYYQRKSLKDLTDFIQKQLKESFDTKLNELKDYNKQEMEDQMKIFKDNINLVTIKNKNLSTELEGAIYFLQGRSYIINKEYTLALRSFLIAAYYWLNTERSEKALIQFVNIKICLKNIKDKNVLEKMKFEISKIKVETFDEIIKYFRKHEKKEIYQDIFVEMEKEIERIKTDRPTTTILK